jgi:hypothetical protein
MVYIYQVQMSSGGTAHQHIASVKWKNPDSGKSGESTRQNMVDFISNKGGSAYVCGGDAHIARVGVVKKAEPPYIRTYADGEWSDNLLALPRY